MRALPTLLVALPLALLAGCDRPPPTAYINGWNAGAPQAQTSIGANAVGEACSLQQAAGGVDIFCGTWQQPSARVREGEAAGAGDLRRLATASTWRVGIDQSYECQAPTETTILDGRPAELLDCTQRRLGWPHVALVALANGRAWYADGVKAAFTPIERGIGISAGLFRADAVPPSSAADSVMAQRLAAAVVSSGDIGQYDALMAAGTRANLDENPSAAEAAFRAALALQRKALGESNPNTVTAMMTLAVQLSNEGRFAEAAILFGQAGQLAPRASDPIAPARLLHYRGLDALNRGQAEEALGLLRAAEKGYAAQLPPEMASEGEQNHTGAFTRSTLVTGRDVLTDPAAQAALIGVIEARRNEAVALNSLGRTAEARTELASATAMAEGHGLARPILAARLLRNIGLSAASTGDASLALTNLARATTAFGQALPDSKPLAETTLLQVRELARAGRAAEALPLCQSAVSTLVRLKVGTTPELIEPCLDAYGTAAEALSDPTQKQALLAEMFTASQLGQGGVTSQQIAQATARLQANARDPRVADAIRRREDASTALQALVRKRETIAAATATDPTAQAALTEIDAKVKEAETALADSDAALQAAAPNFGQLAQQVAPASAVFAGLRPDEALLQIALGPHDGWSLVLHDGQIAAAKIPVGLAAVGKLVAEVREGIEVTDRLPTFDVAGAQKLYDLTIAGVAPALGTAKTVVVVPAGPLLALPFEVLLSGPADAQKLAEAPWLVRRFTLTHVPAAANFVSLRKTAGGSRATRQWFGFGDFVPLTLAQTRGSFPAATCADSAELLAGLPPLPGARKELDAARALFGEGTSDWLLGPAFTRPAVLAASLKQYRILHFAAHALLPSELTCQSEPAIVTSDPAGSPDAKNALLTAADVTQLDLDADLVILSACNSGGGGGGSAGESLSGLARAFFYAGARTLLVTHWSVSDAVAKYLVVLTLHGLQTTPGQGVAASLRQAQLRLIDEAGKSLPPEVAHPFFWAPFAAIGESGGGAGGGKTAAAQGTSPAPSGQL
jgi:CHAT domain-containing protein/tetratricopeptide (TPR) repeat protein